MIYQEFKSKKDAHTIDDGEGVEDDDAAGLLGGEQYPPPHRPAARPLLPLLALSLLPDLGLLLAAAAGPLERRAPGRHEHPGPAQRRSRAGRRDGEQHAAGWARRRRHPSPAPARLQRQRPRRGRDGRCHAKTAAAAAAVKRAGSGATRHSCSGRWASKIRWKSPEECPGRQNVQLVGRLKKGEEDWS
jgi:hypothetical protein